MQPAKSQMSLASRTADTDLSASSSSASDPKSNPNGDEGLEQDSQQSVWNCLLLLNQTLACFHIRIVNIWINGYIQISKMMLCHCWSILPIQRVLLYIYSDLKPKTEIYIFVFTFYRCQDDILEVGPKSQYTFRFNGNIHFHCRQGARSSCTQSGLKKIQPHPGHWGLSV